MKSIVLPLLLCGLAGPALAQSQTDAVPGRLRHAAGVVAGASQFDLSGTGTTPVVGARAETELTSWLLAEGALGVIRPAEQLRSAVWYVIPEAQLQVQWPARIVRPYLGAGGGLTMATDGRGSTVTVSGASGLRVALPGTRLDARAELRVRGIGPSFGASTAEWTLGLTRRF